MKGHFYRLVPEKAKDEEIVELHADLQMIKDIFDTPQIRASIMNAMRNASIESIDTYSPLRK